MKLSCLHPFIKKMPTEGHAGEMSPQVAFPCGKCPVCQSKIARDWTLRLQEEASHYPNKCVFVTLTYNEQNIKKIDGVGVLCKRDVQLFFKRLRIALERQTGKSPDLRYFIIGEYGPNTLRPHYHAILFGLPHDQSTYRLVFKAWKNGFITLDEVTPGRISYVASYMLNFLLSSLDSIRKKYPPFRTMSRRQGIGYRFLTPDRQRFYLSNPNQPIRYRGFLYRFPRYYQDKLFKDYPEIKQQRQAVAMAYLKDQQELYFAMYGEMDQNRRKSGHPTVMEEMISHFLEQYHHQYVFHKLKRRL
ncbi:MAG: replication initiator protein [Chaetfec virus UA24_2735]|nr:MAG: replication initiator protein [Chaetfec virus UA24_2735]